MLLAIPLLVGCDEKHSYSDVGEDEEEEFVCTPTTAESECNAQFDCGCTMGDWCRWMFSATNCLYYEGCTPSVPGTLGPGESCDPSWHYPDPPWCLPGHVCVQYPNPDHGVCAKICQTAADCEAGRECGTAGGHVFPAEVCEGGPITPPFLICSWL